jgi:hypothetical protein
VLQLPVSADRRSEPVERFVDYGPSLAPCDASTIEPVASCARADRVLLVTADGLWLVNQCTVDAVGVAVLAAARQETNFVASLLAAVAHDVER